MRLKFSGLTKTSGRDRNQKTTNPVNSAVVVGISESKEFGMLLYEGHSAVRQTLRGTQC